MIATMVTTTTLDEDVETRELMAPVDLEPLHVTSMLPGRDGQWIQVEYYEESISGRKHKWAVFHN